MWMLLVLLYGVLKGAREIVKKKALTKSSVIEVLFFYTLLGFLFVIPQAPAAMGLEPKYYFWIAVKNSATKSSKNNCIILFTTKQFHNIIYSVLLCDNCLVRVLLSISRKIIQIWSCTGKNINLKALFS